MDEQTFHSRINIFMEDRRKSVEWLCGSPWALFVALAAIIWAFSSTLDGTTPARILLFHAFTIYFILIIPLSILGTSLLSATVVLPEGRTTTTKILYQKQFVLYILYFIIIALALLIGIINYNYLPKWYNLSYTLLYSLLILSALWMLIPRPIISVSSNQFFQNKILKLTWICLFLFGFLHCYGSYKLIQLNPISIKHITFIISFNGLMICFWVIALASQTLHEIKKIRSIRDYGMLNGTNWDQLFNQICEYLYGRKT